jgi:hypothetical protein
MKLTKEHRECLLDELKKTQADLDLQKQCLLENKLENLKDRFEMHCFLAEQRIKLIEQTLINNEIDF